jgi:hypothetical protein
METNILLFCLLAGVSTQNNTAASSKAMDAYLKYTGVSQQIETFGKRLEKEVPEEIKFYAAPGVYVAQTIIQRQIIFRWTFP